MSKKDFDEYYNSLCNQYVQLTEQIEEFQKMVSDKAVEPERLEILKKTFQPIMDSYQMISWVAFLLNKPAKKEKQNRYNNMMSKRTSKLDAKFNKESIMANNESTLEKVKEIVK